MPKPLHEIWTDTHARPGFFSAMCTCGWTFHHKRQKVTDRAREKHRLKFIQEV